MDEDQLTTLYQFLTDKFDQIDARFERADTRFDQFDLSKADRSDLRELEARVDAKFDRMDARFDQLFVQLDEIRDLLDTDELERGAQNIQLGRHEDNLDDHDKRITRLEKRAA